MGLKSKNAKNKNDISMLDIPNCEDRRTGQGVGPTPRPKSTYTSEFVIINNYILWRLCKLLDKSKHK